MEEEKTILIEVFGRSPVIRIVDFFLDNQMFDYSKEEVIKNLDISKITFYKYFSLLEKNGLFRETRRIGKAKLYKLNEKNEVVKALKSLVWALGIKAMEKSLEEGSVSVPIRKSIRHK